jgi:hypothetical protein
MSARFRIKEHRHRFTPQQRVLGLWISMAKPQPTWQAADEIIHRKLARPAPAGIENNRAAHKL